MRPFITHKGLTSGVMRLGLSLVILAMAQKAEAQTPDLDNLCQKYPLNSRCESYVADNPQTLNNLSGPPQALIVQLDTVGSDTELVLIELNQEDLNSVTVSAHHMERFEGSDLLSSVLNGGIEAAASGIPVPFDLFNFYESVSSHPEYLAFTPDNCQIQPSLVNGLIFQDSNCSITGVDNLSLSEEIDIRSGTFTLGYTEGDLIRVIAFRLRDHNTVFADELETEQLCQRYPLNFRCRYWPISQVE